MAITADFIERLERLEAAVAELSAGCAQPPEAHDPLVWRKRLLRRAWREYYAGMSRSAAARAMALDWRSFYERSGRPRPGTADIHWAELMEQGCKPLASRQINDDLDQGMDQSQIA